MLPDGRLPGGGALPCAIDREGRPSPATRMPENGLPLADFVVEHPEPEAPRALHARLGITRAPRIEPGERVRYRAEIGTPGGRKTLW